MTVDEMEPDRLRETLMALRSAARYRDNKGRRHFAHLKEYRAAFVLGILERRRLLRVPKEPTK